MHKRSVINVVSGKGGTGKTLFCAVLADLLGNHGISVLVVDLDIFVRGLTALLYFHRKEALRLTAEGKASVADVLLHRESVMSLGIENYRSCEVLPSVSRIDETLNFRDTLPASSGEAKELLAGLISALPARFEIVL